MRTASIVVLSTALLVGCGPTQEAPEAETGPGEEIAESLAAADDVPPLRAEAILLGPDGAEMGRALFTQQDAGVLVEATVQGVARAGLHGFHIHESGACEPPDFASAGGHFAPANNPHGCPPATPRHAGDLGNIEVDDNGDGSLELTTDLIELRQGDRWIVDRAVILHEGEDDCTTQPTGDAGGRLACGRIVLLGDASPTELEPPAEGGS